MLTSAPNPRRRDEPLFECFDCGTRPTDPESRLCECGGYLRNIAVARDQ